MSILNTFSTKIYNTALYYGGVSVIPLVTKGPGGSMN